MANIRQMVEHLRDQLAAGRARGAGDATSVSMTLLQAEGLVTSWLDMWARTREDQERRAKIGQSQGFVMVELSPGQSVRIREGEPTLVLARIESKLMMECGTAFDKQGAPGGKG